MKLLNIAFMQAQLLVALDLYESHLVHLQMLLIMFFIFVFKFQILSCEFDGY